ncbi:MAG: glycosyltransferase family 9 protein [Candidatus Xenobium sp.]|jgi:heptosyltransferase-3|nr:glycosyltransferase family 9 protein [Burkholderiales bacterium]
MKSLPLAEIRSVVVIRTDHVGDLVLSTPFLRALRQGLPQARITALLPPYTSQVLQGSPLVDEVLVHDRLARPVALEQVRASRPDLAISLAPRSRSYRLAWRTGARYRVGYVYAGRPLAKLACQAWLTHRMTVDLEHDLAAGRPIPHEIEQLQRLAGKMGLPCQEDGLELTIPQEDLDFGRHLVEGWGSQKAALHLSGGWVTEGWRIRNLVRLVEGLLWSTNGGGVLITYGPAEEAMATRLAEGLATAGLLGPGFRTSEPGSEPTPCEPLPIRLAGGLTFKQWAAALAACSCVVSPDTGAVHVAAAMGRPVVAVYQASSRRLCSQQWAPWQVPHRMVTKGHPVPTMSAILQGVEELLLGS